MNILMLCYEYPPIGGGGGIGVRNYAEAWAAKGHRVMVLTSRAKGLQARERMNGLEIVRVTTFGRRNRATATNLSMLSYNLWGLFYIVRNLGSLRQFGVLNAHFSIPTGPLAWVASKIIRRPNVLTIIGGDIYDPTKSSSPHRKWFLRQINKWIINGADQVVAISSDTKKRAEHYYAIQRPIRVINYGFTPQMHQDLPPEDHDVDRKEFRLIAVGRMVPRKGFEHLLQAMRLLPKDVVLILIGDGPLKKALQDQAEGLGVGSRVRFLGFQNPRDIYHQLRKADCFVLSSLHEGLGIVVLEAMDAGLPIVATNDGGQVDLIRSGRNAILVKPADPQALADAIRQIRDDSALAESMRQNNLRDIQNHHMDKNCELYLDLFRRLVPLEGGLPQEAA
jgi:glycosyltransferase involved in cell wall biosynthesis